MENQDKLDFDIEALEQRKRLKKSNKRLLSWAVLTTLIFVLLMSRYYYPLLVIDEENAPAWKFIIIMKQIANIGLAFVLALFLSFIPYQKLPYKKKYLRTSYISLIIIQIANIYMLFYSTYIR